MENWQYRLAKYPYDKILPFTQSFYNWQPFQNPDSKRPSKPNFKLEPYCPVFNVRFYCNDGRFYYDGYKKKAENAAESGFAKFREAECRGVTPGRRRGKRMRNGRL